jgi:hypothetical protein
MHRQLDLDFAEEYCETDLEMECKRAFRTSGVRPALPRRFHSDVPSVQIPMTTWIRSLVRSIATRAARLVAWPSSPCPGAPVA